MIRTNRAALGASVVALLVLAGGCAMRGGSATRPTLQKDVEELMGDITVLPPFPEPIPSSGSLWTDGGSGAAMFRDPRAFRVNDLVTIVLDERSLGAHESGTDLNRSSQADVGADIAFGLEEVNPIPGMFNLNQILTSNMETAFAGDGTTSRSSQLSARITTRVLRVLPNGDLVVGGQKNVIINRERQALTLVGSVRAVDVGSDNRVSSSSVGDLTVRLWGQGEIDSTTRQGWFMRILNHVWPF